MSTIKMNKESFVNFVKENVVGTSAVTVYLDSPMDSKMNKTGNPFYGKGLVKRESLNGMIGYKYEDAVNRIANAEGQEEREAQPHKWGDLDEKRLIRTHRKNGKNYLSMQVKKVNVEGVFTPENTEIRREDIKPFEKTKKYVSSTQAGLEKKVDAKDFSLENITSVKMKGITIELN